MWPVSCASTPMIWFGVCDSISAPALTKMRLASITKALKLRSLMMHDADVLLRQAGGAQDRLGVVAQQLLDLGVADERQAARGILGACAGMPASATDVAAAATRPSRGRRGRARRCVTGRSSAIIPVSIRPASGCAAGRGRAQSVRIAHSGSQANPDRPSREIRQQRGGTGAGRRRNTTDARQAAKRMIAASRPQRRTRRSWSWT